MGRKKIPVVLIATLDKGDALGNIELTDRRTQTVYSGKIIDIEERQGEVMAFKSILLRTDIGFDMRIICKHPE